MFFISFSIFILWAFHLFKNPYSYTLGSIYYLLKFYRFADVGKTLFDNVTFKPFCRRRQYGLLIYILFLFSSLPLLSYLFKNPYSYTLGSIFFANVFNLLRKSWINRMYCSSSLLLFIRPASFLPWKCSRMS